MAKSRTRPPRKPVSIDTNTPFDEPIATDTPQEPTQTAQTAPDNAPQPEVKKIPSFIERMNRIEKKDWGPRATIYLYRVEPVIDRTRSGDVKYIMTYAEPVNEDRIMADCGSGRYKLILNFRKPGADQGDTVDQIYMEILNMKYPPKIPLGEWTDDPRNKKWQWAKEALKPEPTPASQAEGTLAAFDTFLNIQDRVQERLTPAAAAAAPAAAVVDPWAAAERILNMRSDNPMVEILKEQMKNSAASAEAERERAFKAAEAARDREFQLQKQLLESKNGDKPKTFLDQLLELAQADKLEPIKKVVGLFMGNGDAPAGRVARTTAYDVVRDIASSPFGANLGNGLGMLLSNLATQGARPANGAAPPLQQPPVILNAQQPNGTAAPVENAEQRIQRIGQQITQPMLYEFFLKDENGATFAERMFDMWPEDYIFIRALGPENLVNRYRQFPPAWALIAPKESNFIEFIQEFCSWDPNEDEAPAPGPDDGVVDLENQEAGA